MKTNSIYILFCIVAIIFSSCAKLSTLTVEKRHYRNGYYVDFNHNSKSQEVLVKLNSPTGNLQRTSSPDLIPKQESIVYPEVEAKIEKSESNNNIPGNSKIVRSKAGKIINPMNISSAKSIIQTLNKEYSNEKTERDELSLFWSVIVIIVVIWLIAYFTGGWGLGGLINLLLLVALILLILWLLRLV